MHEGVFGPGSWNPLARALLAYARGDSDALLNVLVDDGDADPLPASLFFRAPSELRDVDRVAVSRAQGHVLDLGAGAGSISLALQNKGLRVTAVEIIPDLVRIMKQRGVEDVRQGSVEDLPESLSFDTILILMNGIAMAGSFSRVPAFLRGLGRHLRNGGQILLDSTDLLEGEGTIPTHPDDLPPGWYEGDYPGEVQYQLEFRGEKGSPFPQVFLDPATLALLAKEEGFDADVVWRGEDGAFLARLRKEVGLGP